MISVRRARPGDFDATYEFINELEDEVFDKRKQKRIFTANLKNKNNIYLVCVEDYAIAGYLSCHIQQLLHHGGPVAEIQEMFVRADRRKHGIGKRLLDELKTIVKKKKVVQLEVTSNINRTLTHRFYEREKFQCTHKKFIYQIKNPKSKIIPHAPQWN